MKLTSEEKNKRIAKAIKWQPTTDGGICWDNAGKPIVTAPRFDADLNACREAEKTLTEEQVEEYQSILSNPSTEEADAEYPAAAFWFHASAPQRFEAIGLTLNLWEAGQ